MRRGNGRDDRVAAVELQRRVKAVHIGEDLGGGEKLAAAQARAADGLLDEKDASRRRTGREPLLAIFFDHLDVILPKNRRQNSRHDLFHRSASHLPVKNTGSSIECGKGQRAFRRVQSHRVPPLLQHMLPTL